MKKFLPIIYFLFIIHFSYAQKGVEEKLPIKGNYELSHYAKLHPDKIEKSIFKNNVFAKTGFADSSFPFIERFTNFGNVISSSNWSDANVTKVGQTAVFDALNRFGNVYSGNTFGQADIFTSQPISLTFLNNLYIEFNYSAGSTWNMGDSLVLQFKNDSGNWTSIWQTSTFDINNTVVLQIDPIALSLISSYVVFRFINYTYLYYGNTEDFVLHHVVFAHKLDLPVYENMSTFSNDSFPSKQYWSEAKTNITSGAQFGLTWCNPAVFDALDENKNVYNNSVGSGFADTLASHYIDLSNFVSTDSVFLRFYYQAMPNSKTSDSLILQFKNIAGNWIIVKSFSGTPFNDFRLYSQYINFNNFQSSYFQFRLMNKCTYVLTDTLKWIVSGFNFGKKLSLPLIEDFSSSQIYPNHSLWKDNWVYINNNFPISPPSFNVATFDGLDNRGNPYCNNCLPLVHNYCDYLTSWPINLSGNTVADSIYLSFYIEPGGLGKLPNTNDSFIVDMRNSPYDPNSFTTVWGDVASNYSDTSFTQIFILIDSSFLHDDFQISFKNIGSLNGNTDQWNLDYIRIDRGRSEKDTAYFDNAISSVPNTILKTYTSLPWSHYVNNKSQYDMDTQYVHLKNNYNTSYSINYYRTIYDQQHSRADSSGNPIPNFAAGKFQDAFVSRNNLLTTTNPLVDTVLFTCKYKLFESTQNDYIPTNDILITQQIFSNYFAYDDGSAEAGYDVANFPGSVALGYTLSKPDTLWGISIFFNQSAFNVAGQPFNIMVWKDVAIPDPASGLLAGDSLYSDIVGNPCIYPFSGPVYQNKINGFYYYKFHDPILVDSKFYIGWQQNTIFELNVGLDEDYQINRAYAANPMMYWKTTDVPVWQQTQLTGALMMRPIVGKWINPPLGIPQIQHPNLDVLVYPNPAKNEINIQSLKTETYSIVLMDMAGRLILSDKTENKISLPSLQSGMYLLKITDRNQQSVVKKIIIQQ